MSQTGVTKDNVWVHQTTDQSDKRDELIQPLNICL